MREAMQARYMLERRAVPLRSSVFESRDHATGAASLHYLLIDEVLDEYAHLFDNRLNS